MSGRFVSSHCLTQRHGEACVERYGDGQCACECHVPECCEDTAAAIVAWLRERYPRDGYSGVAELADAIERGEWRRGKEDGR